MTNFLHGAETINKTSGTRVVNEIRSSIIGLIGTAPKGTANTITICQNDSDDAQFGSRHDNYTIPNALNALRSYGVGTIMVINVLGDDTLTPQTLTAPVTHIAGGTVIGGFDYRLASDIMIAGESLPDDLYHLNSSGEIVVKQVSPASVNTVEVAFSWRDPSMMKLADILGGITEHGDRYGLELFEMAYAEYGFEPKIVIAPNFSSHPAIAAKLETLADSLRAVTYCDYPLALTRDEALACRGNQPPLGLTVYSNSSERYRPCYPHVLASTDTGENMLQPSSIHWHRYLHKFSSRVRKIL